MDVIPLSLGIAVGSDAMMSVLLKVGFWVERSVCMEKMERWRREME